MIKKNIILASKSPRRKFLLEEADISFRIVTQDTDEVYDEDMDIYKVPEFLAQLKAQSVKDHLIDDTIIIAADTVVISPDNTIMGKPTDANDARQILSKLSNHRHEVVTGVALKSVTSEVSFSVTSVVYFDEISAKEIDYYIEQYKPYDKAGAYGIQDWIGWCKIKRIEGSYSNIMGLPMNKLYQELCNFL